MRPRPIPELACPVCGRVFRPKALSGGRTAAKYCSSRCRLLAWARRVVARGA